ncbi:MAG: DEAD/DEAH box helicase [Promethearchaeota archaeon]
MITDFTDKVEDTELDEASNKEIFKFITDRRILRVLFENRIFQLREIQKQTIKNGLFFRKSFLVCAPSGSGKTLIGEICAVNNIFQNFGKSIYLVPYKALATEKYFHFKKGYSRFGIQVELSIGDYDVDDSKLQKADIIVTTYEKCDSLLRNFYDKEWIFDISSIIIDEIHIIGESERGPRLESLIVRLNEFLHNPQIIGLSATIANSEFFNSWLSSLGNHTTLIKSEARPVPLHYKIEISRHKDSAIKRMVKAMMDKDGQVLIFLNKRRSAQQAAELLTSTVKKSLDDSEHTICKALEKRIISLKGSNKDLRNIIKNGIAFHHAGLLPRERKLIEDYFRRRIIKVICCTTTLSAGINTPARMVILKDFKKHITSGHNLTNYSGYFENGDGFSYFKPFSANELFQILGRAGRPGLDSVGYGIILVNDIEEKMWIEDHYFTYSGIKNTVCPKYNDLVSGLNKTNTLKEQVLLRIYEEKHITMDKLKSFFEKTYFWYGMKKKMNAQRIPIEQLLMIREITPKNILKLHANPEKISTLKHNSHKITISEYNESTISGYIKTHYGVFFCQFNIETGIQCSCGFKNGISDNFVNDEFAFLFCDHITAFLMYLLKIPDSKFQKYVNSIVPKAVKNQYILNYLFEKGLVIKNKDDTIRCTQFGKLIIRLYLYPVSGVMIRYKLENVEITTYQDVIREAFDVLKAEHRIRDLKMLEPILEWTDEEPLERILDTHSIMAGDLYNVRDSLERIITFIRIIANNLSTNGIDLKEKLTLIADMAETLSIRIHHGIREELFDLVLRLRNVSRVRARILYNAGYHTATKVRKENPYVLHQKTGLGIKLCKKIISKEGKKESN